MATRRDARAAARRTRAKGRFFAIGKAADYTDELLLSQISGRSHRRGVPMPAKVMRARRRIGRPPAGARAGERVKDYPQLSIRLPGEVKAKLRALSVIDARPQWRIITDAIEGYLRDRPESERHMVEELAGRSRRRARRSRRGR